MNAVNQKTLLIGLLKSAPTLLVLLFVQAIANAQAPPDTILCAHDGQICSFDGELEVMYGANGVFITKTIKGNSVCLPETFDGKDPVPNVVKGCYIVQSRTTNLAGTWKGYYANGAVAPKLGRITRNGAVLSIDNGEGSISAGTLSGNTINATTWGITGTLSENGTKISWSNNTTWRKQLPVAVIAGSSSTVTFRNNASILASLSVYRKDLPRSQAATPYIVYKQSRDVTLTHGDLPVTAALEVEVKISIANSDTLPIYRATLNRNSGSTYCFEVTGDTYKQTVQPCDGTSATEARHVSFKNEAGFDATMSLDYTQQGGSIKTLKTDETVLGFNRVIYLPKDAAPGAPMTLKIKGVSTTKNDLLSTDIDPLSAESSCYKVWGVALSPKASLCSTSPNARTIKLKNNGGFEAIMKVTYYDRDASGRDIAKSVQTNEIAVLQTDTIEIPQGTSSKPVEIKFIRDPGSKQRTEFAPQTVPANFTGELCYKVEGVAFDPTAATCDDTIGNTTGDIRQIRFQNDAGYDAEMIVTYFEDQVVGGRTMAMPKTLTTGMINGLGGKFRLINIPKITSKGMPVSIGIQGKGTLKKSIFSTTLPENFAATPQPCFKTWGTLFDASGGTCNQ